jgi:F-type H+-transporting ATPase subunit epsilon
MQLNVCVLNPKEVIFEGKARSIVVPGEEGVFEVMPFHKRILSRLLSGIILIDDKNFPVKRGIIKVNQDKVTIIVEQ